MGRHLHYVNDDEWKFLVIELLIIQSKRIDELETAVQTLENAVTSLEAAETPLGEAVTQVSEHLSSLEAEVKSLEEAGTLSPDKAKELSDKINNAAAAVTVATAALKGA